MADAVEVIDGQLEALFAAWNVWTTLLILLLVFVAISPLILSKDPDTHPLLLSRQSNVSLVRQPNESAVFRSLEIPHGLPLRSGLNVKEVGASKWSAGTDGDLRDVWLRAVNGITDSNGQPTGRKPSFRSVHGKEIEDHDLTDLTGQINIIGSYLKEKGSTCVAIYLPNSVEMLLAVFAAAFYGFHPVLIPYNQPQDVVLRLIQMASADYLIASAGTIPFDSVKAQCQNLREVMWVVQKSGREMDWDESSDTMSNVTWHELVEAHKGPAPVEFPKRSEDETIPDVISIWLNNTATSGEIVAFTQKNMVAAIAAQGSALPVRHRLSPDDAFLPAESLTAPYVLVQTLASIWAGSTILLTSVAGEDVELPLVCAGVAPTVIAASAPSARKLHEATLSTVSSITQKMSLRSQTQSLRSGYMPSSSWTSLGASTAKLRLLYVFERVHSGTPPLSPSMLSDLRAFTGARVIYALTAAKVVGPVAQTAFYDYRIAAPAETAQSHFGPPVSSLEIKLLDTDTHKTVDGQDPVGEIVVVGPAVSNGRANLGAVGTFRQDGTLAYV